jgi:hypothetical protein
VFLYAVCLHPAEKITHAPVPKFIKVVQEKTSVTILRPPIATQGVAQSPNAKDIPKAEAMTQEILA